MSGRGISSQLSLTKSIKRSNQRSNRRKALGQELSIEPLSSVVDAATAAGMPKQVIAPSDVKWDNVADLFWLGSELDWTAQAVLRGAPKEGIVHGLYTVLSALFPNLGCRTLVRWRLFAPLLSRAARFIMCCSCAGQQMWRTYADVQSG